MRSTPRHSAVAAQPFVVESDFNPVVVGRRIGAVRTRWVRYEASDDEWERSCRANRIQIHARNAGERIARANIELSELANWRACKRGERARDLKR